MGRKKTASPRTEGKGKDAGKKFKKKVCVFCKERVDWVDYKDVNLLRRFMSDRAKIRARRVTGNCAQHQRDVAIAIKTARELALLPYATRVTSSRGGGGGGRGRGRDREGGGRDFDRDRDRDRESGEPGAGAGVEDSSVGDGVDGAAVDDGELVGVDGEEA